MLICLYLNVTSGYDFEYKNKLDIHCIPSTNSIVGSSSHNVCLFKYFCFYFVSAQNCGGLAVSSDTTRNRQKMKNPKVENMHVCYLMYKKLKIIKKSLVIQNLYLNISQPLSQYHFRLSQPNAYILHYFALTFRKNTERLTIFLKKTIVQIREKGHDIGVFFYKILR